MGDGFSIRVDVENHDIVLDGDCCRKLDSIRSRRDSRSGGFGSGMAIDHALLLRVDNGTLSRRVVDILDSDWDFGSDDLLHGERMDDLAAVICQFGCFIWSDDRYQSRRGYLPRISRKDTVYLFPDLQFRRRQSDST